MQDIYMVLLLAAIFILFAGFMHWCDRAIQEEDQR